MSKKIFVKLNPDGANTELNDKVLIPVVEDSINENNSASTFNFKLDNTGGVNKDILTLNDKIDVYISDSDFGSAIRIFRGYIITKKDTSKGSNNDYISITCKNNYGLLQRATVEPVTYRNQEASVIVKDLIATTGVDVTVNNVFVTPFLIPAITFKHNKLSEALNSIAEKTGRIIYVDVDSDLHFEEKNAIASGVILKSGVNIVKESFTQKLASIVNKVWVYGSKILTRAPTVEYVATGGSVFTLPDKPHNTQVYVDNIIQKGNVFEFANDIPSGTDYLVDFDQSKIIFISGTNAGDNIPTSGVSGTFIYDRESIIARFGQNDVSILDFGATEKVIIDDTITTTSEAEDTLKVELKNNSDPRFQGNINTIGIELLTVGRTVEVVIPNAKIDSQYNILSITYDLSPEALALNKIQTIKVAKKVKDVTDTLKEILSRLQDLGATNISVGDLLSLVRFSSNNINVDIHYDVYTREVGQSLILGHPINGVLGTVGAGSVQPLLGNQTGSYSLHVSGGDF